MRGLQRAAREDHAVPRLVRQLDALVGAGKNHAVLARDIAAAQRRKADLARLACAGVAVARAFRCVFKSILRPAAAASPNSSAVPDGASIFLL